VSKKIEKKLKEIKKEVMDSNMIIYIPTEKQIIAKAQVWAKAEADGKVPREMSKYVELPAMSDFGKSTWQKWFAQDGFETWVYGKEDFQDWIDERSTSMARRLYELAFKEKGNAAVSAAKAFLELSTYKKNRIEIKDEYDNMSDSQLMAEVEKLERAAKEAAGK